MPGGERAGVHTPEGRREEEKKEEEEEGGEKKNNYKYCKSTSCQTSQRQTVRSASVNHVGMTLITRIMRSDRDQIRTRVKHRD